jgi:DNA polymerase V
MTLRNIISRGGRRQGAGRKPGSGVYGEPTALVRVPQSIESVIKDYLERIKTGHKPELRLPSLDAFRQANTDISESKIPVYSFKIAAGETTGFKSPAQDYAQETLDLNLRFIANPSATFLFKVGKNEDSMMDVGIIPGCIVGVDTSIKSEHNSIVVAAVDDEWVVKRLYKRGGMIKLLSENEKKNYPPIHFKEGQELRIFGVVKFNVNEPI